MAAQTVTKTIGQQISVSGFFCKDSNGNPCTGLTNTLNVVSGDPTGLTLVSNFGQVTGINCVKEGTYTITITSSNSGGSITTDAAGDADGTTDTINVVSGAPATQGWTYA